MSKYQVTCVDCLKFYGGFETKREAREWLAEHEAFHAGETTEADA